jgi:hypothetical protein
MYLGVCVCFGGVGGGKRVFRAYGRGLLFLGLVFLAVAFGLVSQGLRGSGFVSWISVSRVSGFGFRVQALWLRASGSGFRSFGFGVWGLVFGVWDSGVALVRPEADFFWADRDADA